MEALENKNYSEFLRLVRESGKSSAELLQNLYSTKKPAEQAIPLALMISKRILEDKGAYRVQGGGFAGTIQAFVPKELVKEYIDENLKCGYSYSPAHQSRQRAASVASLGKIYCEKGMIEKAEEHLPEYLRLSQAERERKERENGN